MRVRRLLLYAAMIFSGLLAVYEVLFTINIVRWYAASVTLPNGMVLMRSFDWQWYYRSDLFAADRRRLLARAVEGVCFNDRYVWVYSYDRGFSGLYDAKTGGKRVGLGYPEAMAVSGLSGSGRVTCGGGYYTGMLGPGILYDEGPFRPPCEWRNLGNPALRNPDWLDRSCDDSGQPRPVAE